MSDKTESISDKLRRWADESKNKQRNIYPTLNAGEDFGINLNQKDFIIECELFRRIADEIDAEKQSTLRNCAYPLTQEVGKPLKGDEDFKSWLDRYYLPRPLFEDGEPVQSSDIEEIGSLATCCVYTDGSWRFDPDKFEDEENPKHCDKQQGRQCDRIKRPKQPVLDADGVPIEVGDAVWILKDSEHAKWTVIEPYDRYDGIQTVYVESRGIRGHVCPENLTHREPDSLKKLLNDIRGYLAESPCIDVHVRPWEQRLTALVELDGRDA